MLDVRIQNKSPPIIFRLCFIRFWSEPQPLFFVNIPSIILRPNKYNKISIRVIYISATNILACWKMKRSRPTLNFLMYFLCLNWKQANGDYSFCHSNVTFSVQWLVTGLAFLSFLLTITIFLSFLITFPFRHFLLLVLLILA